MHVSWDTLQRRYAEVIKIWRGQGPMSVRRELYTTAIGSSKGKVPAMIFFLKNYGGMADVIRDGDKGLEFGNLPVAKEFAQSRTVNKPN